MAYVTHEGDDASHHFVARVALFREEEVGPQNQVVVDVTRLRTRAFFVRVADLGRAKSFVPVMMRQPANFNDGNKTLLYSQKRKTCFWWRKQYVVNSYPVGQC